MTDLLAYHAKRWYRKLEHTLGVGEVVVDLFAGGGGASTGIEYALGRPVDVAINHDPHAIAIHKLNHPDTYHFECDIREVDPRGVLPNRSIGLLWASPDCTHHSKAKGGKPLKRGRRALANLVIVWAATRLPRVICLENVQEWLDWGPLTDEDKPDKAKKGQSFNRWKNKLIRLGYDVEHRVLVAADFGVPTIRKRLFLIARRDGKPIVWPNATHAPRDKAEALGLKPWRSAAECIDWSIPCKSIFTRKKELAENTMSRIANGLRRYVLESKEPYIVRTGKSTGVSPVISQASHKGKNHDVQKPLNTITATPDGGDMQLIHPMLVRTDMHKSNSKCVYDAQDPLRTITTTGGHGLASAILVSPNHKGDNFRGQQVGEPMNTITAHRDYQAVVEAFLTKHKKKSKSRNIKDPLATQTQVVSDGLATVFLNKHYTGVVGSDLKKPLGTVTSQDHHSLTTAWLEKFYGTAKSGKDIREPMPTVTGGGYHIGKVSAFLTKYYGSGETQNQSVKKPLHAITTKARMGLVTIFGTEYQIVDIGLRMLVPMELLRAQFGKFAKGYKLIGNIAQQISAIGNSVPPEWSEQLVKSNY